MIAKFNIVQHGQQHAIDLILKDSSAGPGTVYLNEVFMGVSDGTNELSNPGFESGSGSWSSSRL